MRGRGKVALKTNRNCHTSYLGEDNRSRQSEEEKTISKCRPNATPLHNPPLLP
jgi:hypothetical protein